MVRSLAALVTDVSRSAKNPVSTEFLCWIRKDLLREVFYVCSFSSSVNDTQPGKETAAANVSKVREDTWTRAFFIVLP